MSLLAPILLVSVIAAAFYFSESENPVRALLAAIVMMILGLLVFLDLGSPLAAVIQLSLAAGFAASAMLLLPELRGDVEPGQGAGALLGLAGVFMIVVSLSFSGLGIGRGQEAVESWAPGAVALAGIPLLSAALSLRALIRRWRK